MTSPLPPPEISISRPGNDVSVLIVRCAQCVADRDRGGLRQSWMTVPVKSAYGPWPRSGDAIPGGSQSSAVAWCTGPGHTPRRMSTAAGLAGCGTGSGQIPSLRSRFVPAEVSRSSIVGVVHPYNIAAISRSSMIRELRSSTTLKGSVRLGV